MLVLSSCIFLPHMKKRRSTRRKNQPTSFFLLVFSLYFLTCCFSICRSPVSSLPSFSPLVGSVALSHVWCSLYSQHACKTLSSATGVLHCRNDIASFSSGFCCFFLVSASVMWWARIMMGRTIKQGKLFTFTAHLYGDVNSNTTSFRACWEQHIIHFMDRVTLNFDAMYDEIFQ